ncbi:MAG: PEP-CTERM sorting domain-containing protein [Rivularia sp. (in: Bacteria)]|nr:PEP-CTERM sorting domain-containing protein [Rivularia sp. MS3]
MKNQILKGLLVAVAVPLTLVLGNPSKASALVSISSTVTGSANPNRVFDTTLQNGDFTSTANPGNPARTTLGDGLDENTWWVFDYSNDSNLGAFRNAVTGGNEITSALLTVTMQRNGGFNDTFYGARKGIAMSTLESNGVINSSSNLQTFTIDLFDYGFTSAGIFGELDASTASNRNVAIAPDAAQNQILFAYQDDALISSASLVLTTDAIDVQEVPEPTALLGTVAVVGFGALQRRRKKQQDDNILG